MASDGRALLKGNTAADRSPAQSPSKTSGRSTAAGGSSPAAPNKAGSGSMSVAGGGTVNPPIAGATTSKLGAIPASGAGNTALTCSTNPTMRILTVAGSPAPAVFTPIKAYHLYTIFRLSV